VHKKNYQLRHGLRQRIGNPEGMEHSFSERAIVEIQEMVSTRSGFKGIQKRWLAWREGMGATLFHALFHRRSPSR
jgi:hypothetical protein